MTDELKVLKTIKKSIQKYYDVSANAFCMTPNKAIKQRTKVILSMDKKINEFINELTEQLTSYRLELSRLEIDLPIESTRGDRNLMAGKIRKVNELYGKEFNDYSKLTGPLARFMKIEIRS